MKILNSPLSINVRWRNSTGGPITVLVNADDNLCVVSPQETSDKFTLALNAEMMLDISMIAGDKIYNPYLAFMVGNYGSQGILIQNQRYTMWETMPLEDCGGSTYCFIIEEGADGIVIVGTVELVDEDLERSQEQAIRNSNR